MKAHSARFDESNFRWPNPAQFIDDCFVSNRIVGWRFILQIVINIVTIQTILAVAMCTLVSNNTIAIFVVKVSPTWLSSALSCILFACDSSHSSLHSGVSCLGGLNL